MIKTNKYEISLQKRTFIQKKFDIFYLRKFSSPFSDSTTFSCFHVKSYTLLTWGTTQKYPVKIQKTFQAVGGGGGGGGGGEGGSL